MKPITQEEFLARFKKKFPEENIDILNYTGVSRPVTIKCMWCGKKHYYGTGDQLLASFKCCQQKRHETQSKIKKLYEDNDDFEITEWVDQTHLIIKHNKCGHKITRTVDACIKLPYRCKYCEMAALYMPQTAEEATAQLNEKFHGLISLLDFTGKGKNKYRCNKCGCIMIIDHPTIMLSHGCPKCKNKERKE